MDRLETRPDVALCESGSRISIFESGLLGFVVIRRDTCTHLDTCMKYNATLS